MKVVALSLRFTGNQISWNLEFYTKRYPQFTTPNSDWKTWNFSLTVKFNLTFSQLPRISGKCTNRFRQSHKHKSCSPISYLYRESNIMQFGVLQLQLSPKYQNRAMSEFHPNQAPHAFHFTNWSISCNLSI